MVFTEQSPSAGLRMGFGGASIGNLYSSVDDATAQNTVDEAWRVGVRYFDTAPHYGLGLSEERLGRALASHPRDGYRVSTKVGRLLVPNAHPKGSDLSSGGFAVPDTLRRQLDYTRDGVLRSIEGSLRRLGTDRIDIVYVHDPESHLADTLSYALPTLAELQGQQVIGQIGVGTNLTSPLQFILQRHPIDVTMIAGRWTLLDRTAADTLNRCQAQGVTVMAAAPYNSGLLAQPRPTTDSHFDYGQPSAHVVQIARRMADRCDLAGVQLPAAALQFPLRHAAVEMVVVGLSSPAEACENADRLKTPIPETLWPELEECLREDNRVPAKECTR